MIYLRIKNIAVQIANLIFGFNKKNICKGAYYSWEEALKNCTSYKADEILEKTLKATLAVKNGEATYERDSVLFDKIEYSWPLTAGILLAASKSSGKFNVLDFGGSLGTTYFQNRKIICELSDISWHIIEQPHYVEVAKKYIETSELRFYKNITELDEQIKINLVVLSSVLSYLERPYEVLDSLLKLNPPVIIIDRTSFNTNPDDKDVIRIQTVSPQIYTASYPCRFFNETKLVSFIESKGYKILEKFSSIDNFDSRAIWCGFIFIKKN
jgi:putative methyltransferase (TIGR04325 family)